MLHLLTPEVEEVTLLSELKLVLADKDGTAILA